MSVGSIYDHGAPSIVLWAIKIIGGAGVILTLIAFIRYSAYRKATMLRVMWAIWVIGPPVWFACEYFYIFRLYGQEATLSEFKSAQDVMAKLWVALVTLISGILATKTSSQSSS